MPPTIAAGEGTDVAPGRITGEISPPAFTGFIILLLCLGSGAHAKVMRTDGI